MLHINIILLSNHSQRMTRILLVFEGKSICKLMGPRGSKYNKKYYFGNEQEVIGDLSPLEEKQIPNS